MFLALILIEMKKKKKNTFNGCNRSEAWCAFCPLNASDYHAFSDRRIRIQRHRERNLEQVAQDPGVIIGGRKEAWTWSATSRSSSQAKSPRRQLRYAFRGTFFERALLSQRTLLRSAELIVKKKKMNGNCKPGRTETITEMNSLLRNFSIQTF